MASRTLPIALLARSGRHSIFVTPRNLSSLNQLSAPRCHANSKRYLQTTARRLDAQQQANVKVKRDAKGSDNVVVRRDSKVYKDADEAVADLVSGSTILSSGFGVCGTAGT